MNNEDRSNPEKPPVAASAEWTDHEHVSAQVQLEARKLVDLAGSSELARNAIDIADQSQAAFPDDSASVSATAVHHEASFKKALEDFETSLVRPVVSGELTDWVNSAFGSLQDLGELLREEVQLAHASLYATILRQDADLSSRVAELQATDEQLLNIEFDKIEIILNQLRDRVGSSEQDELKAEFYRVELVRQGLEFIIGARTQETAIKTWFIEAFNRDCGTGE